MEKEINKIPYGSYFGKSKFTKVSLWPKMGLESWKNPKFVDLPLPKVLKHSRDLKIRLNHLGALECPVQVFDEHLSATDHWSAILDAWALLLTIMLLRGFPPLFFFGYFSIRKLILED